MEEGILGACACACVRALGHQTKMRDAARTPRRHGPVVVTPLNPRAQNDANPTEKQKLTVEQGT